MRDLSDIAHKIGGVDTASNYGSSEKNIGDSDFQFDTIFTKLAIEHADNTKSIAAKIRASQQRLKSEHINVFIHNSEDIIDINGQRLIDIVNCTKDLGVENVGYSIYELKTFQILNKKAKADIVQYPLNALNRDLHENLEKYDVNKYVRSIFLQGTLTQRSFRTLKLPDDLIIALNKWLKYCDKLNISPYEAAVLQIVPYMDTISGIVVGVDNVSQLKRILKLISKPVILPEYFNYDVQPHIRDPRFW